MPELALRKPSDSEFKVVRVAAPLRHSVVESIRNAIATGRFAAGERLPEKDLCELIGVSRTLVREALRQLESEGLIKVLPNRGSIVARVSMKQAEHIYQVRRELEGLVAELFATHASDADQEALQKSFVRLKATVKNADSATRIAAKTDFYACMLRGSGNEILAETLGLLNSRITLLRATSMLHKGRYQQSISEIAVLVKALLARDPVAARKAAYLHVTNATVAAMDVLRLQQSAD